MKIAVNHLVSLRGKICIGFFAIMIGLLISGCATIKPKDFTPSNIKVSTLLPSLEPLIDLNSCGKAFRGKEDCGEGILCSPTQDLYYQYENDISKLYINDVYQNIVKDKLGHDGFIVLKIIDFSVLHRYGIWMILNCLTATTHCLLGLPAGYYKSQISIEIELRNLNNEVIAKYPAKAKITYPYGYYYGSFDSFMCCRKCLTKTLKLALDNVKEKISTDYQSINSVINKSIEEIQSERKQSKEQSKYEEVVIDEGVNFFNGNNYEEAKKVFNKVLNKFPLHTIAMFNRGLTEISLGKYSSAISDFSKIILLDPDNTNAYLYKGIAYAMLIEPYAAIYYYSKALVLNDQIVDAYLLRGLSEEEIGLYEDAISDYKKTLILDPDRIDAKERLKITLNKVEQEKIEQERQTEQARIEALNQLNSSLNSLNNSLINIDSKSTNPSNNKQNNSSGYTSPSKRKCGCCDGTGKCPYCNSAGQSKACVQNQFGVKCSDSYCIAKNHKCKHCDGTHICSNCKGSGYK